MERDEVLAISGEAGVILEGHFIQTSGLRSPVRLQRARLFMHADKTERLCRALVARVGEKVPGKIDYVIDPAIGGLIPTYQTSGHLGVPVCPADALPPELAAIAPIKPGSRTL